MNIIAPSQAWSMLQRHADKDVKPLRLSELIRNHDTNNNEDGVDAFVEVLHNSENNTQFIVDWSRQRTTSDTMNHLLRLSTAKEIRERIYDLAWGRLASGSKSRRNNQQNKVSFANNLGDTTSIYEYEEDETEGEIGGSMHLSLRAPEGLVMHDPCSNNKKKNAIDAIHKDWHRIQTLTESIRKGNVRGVSGKPLCDVLVISGDDNSVVTHSLEFVYQSLLQNEEGGIASSVDSSLISISKSGESMSSSTLNAMKNMVTTPFKNKSGITSQTNNTLSYRKRKLKILTSADDSTILRETLSQLSPSNTFVVSLDLEPAYEKNCKTITSTIRDWLVSDLMDTSNENRTKEAIVKKHMYIVTVNETLKKLNNSNAFLLPRHSRCESFSTCSAAGILPLSLIFGWEIVSSFLKGSHYIDRHFVDTNPRHNLPFILALLDLWNDEFLQSRGKAVRPYSQSLASYPGLVAVIENKVLRGQGSNQTITGSHVNDQCTEFIMTLQPGQDDDRICSLLAYADTLAFGNTINNKRMDVSSPGSHSQSWVQRNDSMLSHNSTNHKESSGMVSSGNQPSTLVLCGDTAFACGQLIAMTEHRTLITAWLRGIDPFTTTEKASLQAEQQRKEQLTTKLQHMQHGEHVEEDQVNSSTMTILKLIN